MKKITVETTLTSPIEKVWDCWTLPKHITQWNFASDNWCCPEASNDLKVGGKFNWRMESKDGVMGFDFEGIYQKITQFECISYKMPDGRLVEIEFLKKGNEILVRETFDMENMHSEEQQRAGWQAILENFKKHAETIDD